MLLRVLLLLAVPLLFAILGEFRIIHALFVIYEYQPVTVTSREEERNGHRIEACRLELGSN